MDTEVFDGPIFPVEKTEENCDLIMDVQESTRMSLGLEPFHDLLSSSPWMLRGIRRVDQAIVIVLAMFELRRRTAARCSRAITDSAYEQGARTDVRRLKGLIIAMTSAVSPDSLPHLPLTWFPLPSP